MEISKKLISCFASVFLSLVSLFLVPSALAVNTILNQTVNTDLDISTLPTANGIYLHSRQAASPAGLYLDINNNVGIGTNSPADILHILQTTPTGVRWERSGYKTYRIGNIGPGFVVNDVTDNQYHMVFDGSGNVGLGGSVGTNLANATLVATSGGSVGIGTTSPAAQLDVRGTSTTNNTAIYGYQTVSGAGPVYGVSGQVNTAAGTTQVGVYGVANSASGTNNVGGMFYSVSGTNNVQLLLGTSTPSAANPGQYSIYSAGSAPSYFAGNVGIGTTSPVANLEVGANNQTSGNENVNINGYNSANLFLKNSQSNQTWRLMSHAIGSGIFRIQDVEANKPRLTISPNGGAINFDNDNVNIVGGSVGIGTATPGQKLSVVGTIESTSGGFKFPDGTTQVSATGGSATISAGNVSSGSFGLNTGLGNYVFPSLTTSSGTIGSTYIAQNPWKTGLAAASNNGIGLAMNRLLGANTGRYTVTSTGFDTAQYMFDGLYDQSTHLDNNTTGTVTVDFNPQIGWTANTSSGFVYTQGLFVITFYYTNIATNVTLEAYTPSGGADSWSTIYTTTTNTASPLIIPISQQNYWKKIRVTMSNPTVSVWLTELEWLPYRENDSAQFSNIPKYSPIGMDVAMPYLNFRNSSWSTVSAIKNDGSAYFGVGGGGVGIGNSSPGSYKLNVTGNAQVATAADTVGLNVYTAYNSDAVTINKGGGGAGYALNITDTGAATGIEVNRTTSTAPSNSIQAGVDIQGAYQHNGTLGLGSGININVANNTGNSGTLYGANISATANTSGATAVGLNVNVASSSGTKYAALFNGGNVGIGSPPCVWCKLDVYGETRTGALSLTSNAVGEGSTGNRSFGLRIRTSPLGGGAPTPLGLYSDNVVANFQTTPQTGNVYAHWFDRYQVSNPSAATINLGANIFVGGPPTAVSNTTFTNVANLYLQSGATAPATNGYNLYIEGPTNGATNNYALYSASGTNYFGGNIIGNNVLTIAGGQSDGNAMLNLKGAIAPSGNKWDSVRISAGDALLANFGGVPGVSGTAIGLNIDAGTGNVGIGGYANSNHVLEISKAITSTGSSVTSAIKIRNSFTAAGLGNSMAGISMAGPAGAVSAPSINMSNLANSFNGIVIDGRDWVVTNASTATGAAITIAAPTAFGTNYSLYSASGTNYFGGNVGIGVASPTARLTVLDSSPPSGQSGHPNANFAVVGDATFSRSSASWNNGDSYLAITHDATGSIIETPSGGKNLRLVTKAASGVFNQPVTIDSSGNVGIGTTTPAQLLQVLGNVRIGASANAKGCMEDFNGTVIAGSCSSDSRLKKNIVPFKSSLENVAALKPVNYEWRANEFSDRYFGAGVQSGLIAQDVERVLPELVGVDAKGYKTVNYGVGLQMQMIQAIKDLKAENEALKARIGALENRK